VAEQWDEKMFDHHPSGEAKKRGREVPGIDADDVAQEIWVQLPRPQLQARHSWSTRRRGLWGHVIAKAAWNAGIR
jgi:hypothetical protein